jgi:peptide-methionine (S)-S-oxide reductase
MTSTSVLSSPRKKPCLGVSHVFAAVIVSIGAGLAISPSAAEEGRAIPAPALDASPTQATASETAVLAGGCFWGVQGVFQHVKGVSSAVSGYAGGESGTAQYEMVGSGMTGHAESVSVTFDPRVISYGRILQVYFSVAHDPTQLNRQGPDYGTQYRSTIFPTSPEQSRIASAYIDQLNKEQVFDAAIATTIESDRPFYPAEDYHQDFLTLNPTYPYIVINDLPKIEDLKQFFPELYREEPVLVTAAQGSN